jgi:hypothetical protein
LCNGNHTVFLRLWLVIMVSRFTHWEHVSVFPSSLRLNHSPWEGSTSFWICSSLWGHMDCFHLLVIWKCHHEHGCTNTFSSLYFHSLKYNG